MRSNVEKRTLALRIAIPKHTEKNLLGLFSTHLPVVKTVKGLSGPFILLQQKSEVAPGNCVSLEQNNSHLCNV